MRLSDGDLDLILSFSSMYEFYYDFAIDLCST
jgi:hypothetical protein